VSFGKHTPHLLHESLGWHERYVRTGRMRPREECVRARSDGTHLRRTARLNHKPANLG